MGDDTAARRAQALVAVGLAVLAWSASNVAIKLVSVTGLVASFWRLWLAVPVCWAAVLALPAVRRRLDATFLRASVLGGVLFGFHQILFFSALKLTSVATVSVVGALQPAIVLGVAGPLFGEPVSGQTIGWTLVALAGTVVVVGSGAHVPGWTPLGDLIAVANLLVFTVYFLASKRLRGSIGALEYVAGLTTVAAVVVTAACLGHGEALGAPRGGDWLLLVAIALIPGTLGHLLVNWAHAHAPAMITSVMLLGVPVLASAGAMVVLGEPVRGPQVAGGVLVLAAIARLVTSPVREDLAASTAEADAP